MVYCYNPHDKRWCKKDLKNVNQSRKFCCGLVSLISTVFQGHIVVSGGKANIDLQTVEQYIPSQNTWTKLPQMVNRKSLHALCSLNGKLFIVGRQCEVYDTTANRFCVLRSPISFNYVVINRNNCKISYSANRRTVQCFTKYMD